MTPERWRSLTVRLGLSGDHMDVYEALAAAYGERARHYHTAEHIRSCLAQADETRHLARCAEEVEAALWFHDAVYSPRGQDNEAKSAAWAREFLERAGASGGTCARVHGHVMATEHNAAPTDPDSALVVDIDLSILGSPPTEYERFEANVRREYAWVPAPLFRRRRRQILESFLARPGIYFTGHFRDRREQAARCNLEAAIRALG